MAGRIRMARKVERMETAAKALRLRAAGWNYPRIAQELGYPSPTAAWRDCQEAMRMIVKEPADTVRLMELERLDAVLAAIWPRATGRKAEVQVIDRVLRIQERRAKLQGLDAPTRVEARVNPADKFDALSDEDKVKYLQEFIPRLQSNLAEIENRIAAKSDDNRALLTEGNPVDVEVLDER